jgi:hypothetical protein
MNWIQTTHWTSRLKKLASDQGRENEIGVESFLNQDPFMGEFQEA